MQNTVYYKYLLQKGALFMRLLLKTLKYLVITIGFMALLFVGFIVYEYQQTIPNYNIEDTVLAVRASDHYTPLEEISPTFLDALVATEDRRFYKHGGLDFISLGRALITNLNSGEIEQGGSTITQQLAKNLFLDAKQTLSRKVSEMFLAHYLESHYSKDDILELYVNVIYYGNGSTGIYAASENFFGKAPNALDFNEATLLAGYPQAPSYYSNNKAASLERQTQVITALTEYCDTYDEIALSY